MLVTHRCVILQECKGFMAIQAITAALAAIGVVMLH